MIIIIIIVLKFLISRSDTSIHYLANHYGKHTEPTDNFSIIFFFFRHMDYRLLPQSIFFLLFPYIFIYWLLFFLCLCTLAFFFSLYYFTIFIYFYAILVWCSITSFKHCYIFNFLFLYCTWKSWFCVQIYLKMLFFFIVWWSTCKKFLQLLLATKTTSIFNRLTVLFPPSKL